MSKTGLLTFLILLGMIAGALVGEFIANTTTAIEGQTQMNLVHRPHDRIVP